MKLDVVLPLIFALSASNFALAQSGGMNGMDMKNMDMQNCMGMKDMDMQKCQAMMHGKGMKAKNDKAAAHKAVAVVKGVDQANGKVTLAHEPIESLKWPAMTMSFAVKDKALFDKLTPGKKVHVDIVRDGSDYLVSAVQ